MGGVGGGTGEDVGGITDGAAAGTRVLTPPLAKPGAPHRITSEEPVTRRPWSNGGWCRKPGQREGG